MGTINLQALGQLQDRHPLGHAVQDGDDGLAGMARPTEDGVGKDIEHGATLAAAVVDDGRPMAIVRCLVARQRMAARAGQTMRMEHARQVLVVGVFADSVRHRLILSLPPFLARPFALCRGLERLHLPGHTDLTSGAEPCRIIRRDKKTPPRAHENAPGRSLAVAESSTLTYPAGE